MKAFKIMSTTYNEWTLTLCGDGEEKQKLINLANELGISERVIFKPFTNDVQVEMKNASIYAMSSRWEGVGIVVTEALELGVPVVAFNTSGPNEIISDSKAGIIVNQDDINGFANSLYELAINDDKRAVYSNNAIKRAKDFYEDKIVTKWIESFKK